MPEQNANDLILYQSEERTITKPWIGLVVQIDGKLYRLVRVIRAKKEGYEFDKKAKAKEIMKKTLLNMRGFSSLLKSGLRTWRLYGEAKEMTKPLITTARDKISDSEIEVIRETYKREGSIEKTKEITGYSKTTVNKYVRDLSSLKQNSRYNARKVLKIVPETLKIVKEYPNTRIACIVEHIERSNLNKALIGKTKTAGGFVWAYKGEEQLKTPVKKYFVNLIRQEDILLGLK